MPLKAGKSAADQLIMMKSLVVNFGRRGNNSFYEGKKEKRIRFVVIHESKGKIERWMDR